MKILKQYEFDYEDGKFVSSPHDDIRNAFKEFSTYVSGIDQVFFKAVDAMETVEEMVALFNSFYPYDELDSVYAVDELWKRRIATQDKSAIS